MTEKHRFDAAIIGGGIVGCATAAALGRKTGATVAVIEAEDRVAAHQTGNNSGVIHSGLYYRPGSLKAENCTRGRRAMYRFCQEHDIAVEQCGKIVAAVKQEELERLEALAQRGLQNGLVGIKRLCAAEISEHEPNIRGIAGLFVPETGIADYPAVTKTLAAEVSTKYGTVCLNTRFLSCVQEPDGLVLETSRGVIRSRYLINCAGLQSDRVARRCGADPKLRIVPFRGEYYEITEDKTHLVNNLVYPVPDPRFPFLGVHFTRMIQGGTEAGPNAVLAFKREGYRRRDFSLRDTASYLFYGGFWKMALQYGRTGLKEMYRSFSKRAFLRALRRLLPDLCLSDIRRGGAGVRAQALMPDGRLADDFCIVSAKRMIHVLNAPSPAATASLSVADYIAELADRQFGLSQKRIF